jgi:very-short-patch-repair endonuclease
LRREASRGEETLDLHLRAYKIPFEREVCLIPGRKWRVDFYLAQYGAVLEVEGGIWTKSRHGHGKGFEDDARKYNALTLAGFKLLRFSTEMVESGEAIDLVRSLSEPESTLAVAIAGLLPRR